MVCDVCSDGDLHGKRISRISVFTCFQRLTSCSLQSTESKQQQQKRNIETQRLIIHWFINHNKDLSDSGSGLALGNWGSLWRPGWFLMTCVGGVFLTNWTNSFKFPSLNANEHWRSKARPTPLHRPQRGPYKREQSMHCALPWAGGGAMRAIANKFLTVLNYCIRLWGNPTASKIQYGLILTDSGAIWLCQISENQSICCPNKLCMYGFAQSRITEALNAFCLCGWTFFIIVYTTWLHIASNTHREIDVLKLHDKKQFMTKN